MIAITTSSSIRVKPARGEGDDGVCVMGYLLFNGSVGE
jgi:hypothetical protein